MKKIIKYVPVVGQAYGLVDTVKTVSNITDPVQAAITAGEMIIEDCFPPQIKYPLECTLLVAECGAAIYGIIAVPVTGGFSLSLCLGAAKRVIMRRL